MVKKSNLFFPIIVILFSLIIFQNFVGIILAGLNFNTSMNLVILLKEILVYFGIIFLLIYFKNEQGFLFFRDINYKNLNNNMILFFSSGRLGIVLFDLVAILYILCLLAYFLFPSEVPIFLKAVSLRQLLTPVILYVFGRMLIVSYREFILINKVLIYLSVVTVFFALSETYLLNDVFWSDIGINQYMKNKGMEVWAYGPHGLPGNFYTYDYINIIGTKIRRSVSFIADPTLFGQFLVLPTCILIFGNIYKGKLRILFSFILLMGIISTFSKGAILTICICILFLMLTSIKYMYRLIGKFLLISMSLIILIIINNAKYFSSLPAHIAGLTHNFSILLENPLGLGMGMAGNYVKLYGQNLNNTGTGESYIGTMLGQIGFIGFILFILMFLLLFKFLINRSDLLFSKYSRILCGVLIGTILASFMSESAISFISSGIPFVYLGIYATYLLKNGEKNENFIYN
jgi:general stress protein CsbA